MEKYLARTSRFRPGKYSRFFLWVFHQGNRAILCLMVFCFAHCSVKSDGEQPGICPRDCSNSIIGSNDASFQIQAMNSIDSIACDPDLAQRTAFSRPISLAFRVTEKIVDGEVENLKPVPNIAFDPVVVGEMVSAEPPENQTSGGVETEKYMGIVTSKTNWCSDSCGIMSLEIVPFCLPAGSTNNVSVFLHSGALFSEGVSIEIITPESGG